MALDPAGGADAWLRSPRSRRSACGVRRWGASPSWTTGASSSSTRRRSGGAATTISPLHLPRTLRGPVRFEELRRKDAFRGLPGVLADVLPDAFGKQVIRAYYTARGRSRPGASPVQHLLYVGARGIGALHFHPPEVLPARAAEAEALEVAALVADARRIIAGEAEVAIPEIYRIGSSAGRHASQGGGAVERGVGGDPLRVRPGAGGRQRRPSSSSTV